MGEAHCSFCKGKGKLKRNYGIGTPLIEYYCPTCNVQNEKKVSWVECPACNGDGYFKEFKTRSYRGSLTYYRKIKVKTCYMCNGHKKIQITKKSLKKISDWKKRLEKKRQSNKKVLKHYSQKTITMGQSKNSPSMWIALLILLIGVILSLYLSNMAGS